VIFQIQIYIFVVFLLYSGAESGCLEKVLRLAESIADIYQQFPHSCIFIIHYRKVRIHFVTYTSDL